MNLPKKKYKIVYADPPWSYNDKCHSGKRGACHKYDLMSDQEIYSMDIDLISADDCILFMWATFPKIQEALNAIHDWGFAYKTIAFNWVKTNKKSGSIFMGMGMWTRSNSEVCLLATKGKPKRISASVQSVILAPMLGHSKKPDEIRDHIVDLCGDLPRIELFARKKTDGWDAWGNEI